jgi:glycosyltransferase involved in cell wall biosynthesis
MKFSSTHENSSPLVSVVMAVYNGSNLVKDAINSILAQSYSNLEFIIIDDGSTDDTNQILRSFNDIRIRIFTQDNQGLSRSLNFGISQARGKYIARQDHDDISLPSRLERQVEFLEVNPLCGLLGTWGDIWDFNGPTGRGHLHPTCSNELKFELISNNPFIHSSWMVPRDVFAKVGPYSTDPNREPPEDYEMASRIARHYQIFNLPLFLVIYREINNSISSVIRDSSNSKAAIFKTNLSKISSENLAHYSGLAKPTTDCHNFGDTTHKNAINNQSFASICGMIFLLLKAAKNINLENTSNSVSMSAFKTSFKLIVLYGKSLIKKI